MSPITIARSLVFILCAGWAAAAATGTGFEEGGATALHVTVSQSGRFVVSGPDAGKTTEYTRWAEAMAERLERRLGMKIAFSRQSPLRIRLASPSSPAEGIAAHCGYREGRLACELAVNEYVPLDYEELLAAWCRLTLVALVDAGRRPPADGIPPEVPTWLALGVSQTLDPALCARNRRLAYATPPASGEAGIVQMFSWGTLPAGWYRTRAFCGLAVMWLDALRPQGDSFRRILERLAASEPVTAGWVAVSLAGLPDGAALDVAWSGWLRRQERVVQDMGAVSSVLLRQLRELVEVDASVAESPAGIERLTPRDLIAMRDVPAVRLAADERMQQVQALTIGKAPELVDVGQAYALFFEGLVRGRSAWRLRWRLRRAERALATLSELTRARETYVDAFERQPWAPGQADPVNSPAPQLEKSPIEAYIDEAERRFERAEDETGGGPPPGRRETR